MPPVPRLSVSRFVALAAGALIWAPVVPVAAADVGPADPSAQAPGGEGLSRRFEATVHPFVKTYCITCHGGDDPEADLDLSSFSSVDSVIAGYADWDLVLGKLQDAEMPPKKAKKHPAPEQSREIVTWIKALRRDQAQKTAGDPGPVLARRLSNAEYDYTIKDLTGVDIRPAKEFPVDPANQAGFDNSGESLAMSPALLGKYLSAAREVADHLVLTTDGFEFASHPVVTDTDRDKYYVLKIVDFYKRQPTDLADYFAAAWGYRHREALAKSGAAPAAATIAQFAVADKLSPKYLATVWRTLTDRDDNVGPLARLRTMWQALPEPTAPNAPVALHAQTAAMRDYVRNLRAELVPVVPNLTAAPMLDGAQPLVLWKDRQMAANRRSFDPSALRVEGAPPVVAKAAVVAPPEAAVNLDPKALVAPLPTPDVVKFGGKFIAATIVTAASSATNQMADAGKRAADADLVVPADPSARARYQRAFARFAQVFPDAFYITERARVYLDAAQEQKLEGRLLSAGLHSMTGYFRDDGPLYDLVLSAPDQHELDRLWRDFEFVAHVPQRMHTSFMWFERTDSTFMRDPEFTPYRPEDKSVTNQDKIKKLGQLYLAKAVANHASPTAQQAIKEHFAIVAANNLRVEQDEVAAEPRHLQALLNFAERAYRRPLTQPERESLLNFYRTAREKNGLDHDDAVRDSVAAVLMSPKFCYRIDLIEAAGHAKAANPYRRASLTASESAAPPAAAVAATAPAGSGAPATAAQPLSDYALASRLSYFLWSSMPDVELLRHAAAGDLHRPEVMVAQTRRMLKDPRFGNFAAEFMGHWLDFRRFEEHNAVDRGRFPNFDNDLREAMYEEPLRFFTDLVQTDKPIQNLLYGDYTFVNAPLAQLYGIPGTFTTEDWVRVDHADQYGRGGLVPMAVFLTANSPGLRTSPVKRGHWFVSNLLGQRIPPPPATVPSLPTDEKSLGQLTLRETLEQHRKNPVCASCHARFDTFGLALEGYGAIGERRSVDFGGHPIDTRAEFPGGVMGTGLPGLRDYIKDHRERNFIENVSGKLLSYGLGRTLLISDDLLLDDMQAALAAQQYRFGALIETLVTSPQFRMKRAPPGAVTAGRLPADLNPGPLAADNAVPRHDSLPLTTAASH